METPARVLVENTSKTIKLNYLASIALIVISLVLVVSGAMITGVIGSFIGFGWYIGTRLTNWWKHA